MKLLRIIPLILAAAAAAFAAPTTPPTGVTGGTTGRDGTGLTSPANWRNLLGGTTVGQSFFTAPNPSGVSFPRVNADFSISWRSATQLKGDLGLDQVDVWLAAKRSKAGVLVVTSPSGAQEEFAPVANTDLARFNAWTAANAALVDGGSLYVPPGNYYVATSRQTLKSAAYYFDRSRFFVDGNTAPGAGGASGNWMFWANGLTNLAINGQLILDGANVAGKTGIVIQDCPNASGRNIIATNCADKGFWFAPDVGTHQPSAVWTALTATNNGNGIYLSANAEYHLFSQCRTKNNAQGYVVQGGNNTFHGCSAVADVNGVVLEAGPNNSHGSWIGGNINHCTGKGIQVKSGVNLGFTFVGVNIFENPPGGIDLGGAGVTFSSCIINCPITCSTAQEGIHTFYNCVMPLAATTLTTLTGPQRANIKFYNCKTLTGDFAENDKDLGTPTAGNFTTPGLVWPTFNQSTTGSAATLTTSRTIGGSAFNGSANVTGFPAPGDIGGTTPGAGTFTNLAAGVTTLGMTTVTSSSFPPLESSRSTAGTNGILGTARFNVTSSGDMGDGFGSQISFSGADTGGSGFTWAAIGGVRAGADTTGDLFFSTSSAGSLSEAMRIKSNNNVLIGSTTDPATGKLYVAGGVSFAPPASVNPTNNGDLTFERTSNTSLTIKLKGTDGTVRKVSLTLAP